MSVVQTNGYSLSVEHQAADDSARRERRHCERQWRHINNEFVRKH